MWEEDKLMTGDTEGVVELNEQFNTILVSSSDCSKKTDHLQHIPCLNQGQQ